MRTACTYRIQISKHGDDEEGSGVEKADEGKVEKAQDSISQNCPITLVHVLPNLEKKLNGVSLA
jgi:hypothetical protein